MNDRITDSRARGLRKGLTSYGDQTFLFLRKAVIKAVAILTTRSTADRWCNQHLSDYNPCHGMCPI